MKRSVKSIWLSAIVAGLIVSFSSPALAFDVRRPFGDMSKAIYFTSIATPNNAATLGIADGTASGGAYETFESGIVMVPVGDGSWACTAAVYPGASYTYYFEYRIPDFEDTNAVSYTTNEPGGARNDESGKARTITIPDSATSGSVFYNTYADATVYFQRRSGGYNGETVAGTSDTYLANYLTGQLLTGDADSSSLDGGTTTNAFSVDVVQTGDSTFVVSWQFSIGGGGLVANVEGGNAFDSGQFPRAQYGFRIYRSDSPAGGFSGAVFNDVTGNIRGDSNYAGSYTDTSTGGAFTATWTFTDTSIPDTVTKAYYTVLFYTAYRGLQSDTTRQNFAGGFDTAIRGSAIKVYFIVERFEEEVVHPNGAEKGTIYMTPYYEFPDGRVERHPELRFPAPSIRVVRRTREA